ncbi:hypothetical protein ACOME3_007903 [Neoechinorhynchus agilis]
MARRSALLRAIRSEHFKEFCTSDWVSDRVVSGLAGDCVSVFFRTHISISLVSRDGYSETFASLWNSMVHSLNGNPQTFVHRLTNYQMSYKSITDTGCVSNVGDNHSLFRTVLSSVIARTTVV